MLYNGPDAYRTAHQWGTSSGILADWKGLYVNTHVGSTTGSADNYKVCSLQSPPPASPLPPLSPPMPPSLPPPLSPPASPPLPLSPPPSPMMPPRPPAAPPPPLPPTLPPAPPLAPP